MIWKFPGQHTTRRDRAKLRQSLLSFEVIQQSVRIILDGVVRRAAVAIGLPPEV